MINDKPEDKLDQTLNHPHLQKLLIEAKALAGEGSTFLSGLSDAQINWQPHPKTWSIGQCFDHLVVTDRLYSQKLQIAINEAVQKRIFSRQPIQTSLLGKLFLYSLKPEQKIKLRTFRVFYPDETFSHEEIQQRFATHQETLIQLMLKADGLDLNKIKIASPVNNLLKFRLGECFRFLLLHQRRHFGQAQNLTALAEFPKRPE